MMAKYQNAIPTFVARFFVVVCVCLARNVHQICLDSRPSLDRVAFSLASFADMENIIYALQVLLPNNLSDI